MVYFLLPFEAANGELLKLFHGSQSVEKQVGLSSIHESIYQDSR